MYISNQPIHKDDNLNQHGKLLRNPDSNANFMHVNRPSMGSVSSQNQATAENDNFPPASSEHSQNRQQESIQEESAASEKGSENRIDEDDRVHRLSWAHDLRRTYDRPPTDGQSSPHISASNGRHSASRGMSPVEEKSARPYSSASPTLIYATNPPHLASHSVLQYTSPPMVQYSTVPGFHTYAPYYEPFVHLPVHSTVMRTAQSSCSEMLANMGSQVRPGPLLPHSLLPTTVHTHYGAIEGSPLPSPREYPGPGYAIPGSGIYVVGVEPGSRSRHASGEQWQGNDKNEESPHPHPARERWESHERKIHEVDSKTAHSDGRGSRGASPRDLHSSGHHVRFKDPPYQTEMKHERVVYQESPKVAHVLPLQPAPRKEQYAHQLPSGHSLYANALTIQTSMHSPPQLVSPPAAYSSLQLQLSPTPQVRSSTHATISQKPHPDVESQETYNTLQMKESPTAAGRSDVKMLQGTNTSHSYPPPATHKLSADAEYPGPSTFPSYFTRGSVIQLASGVLKRVEDLCTDDFIQSAAVTDGLKIDSSTVVRIEDVAKPVAIISFSVGEHREQVTVEATLEHPFYVFGHGWSSVNPELTLLRYNLECHKLAVGDVCVSLTPKEKPPFHKEEHPESIQRTYIGNKRQRVAYMKNPSDTRDIDKNRDPYSSSEQRQHVNTVNPMEHWYRPPGLHLDKHNNNLASELKSPDVSSCGSTRNVSQAMCNIRTSNASSRPDSKSSSIKGKHTYQTLEEVKEEEEEPSELLTKHKTSHGKSIEEPVDHLAKITIAR